MRRSLVLAAIVLILGGVVRRSPAGDAPPAAPPAPSPPAPKAELSRQMIDLGNGVSFEMVLIPAGEFDMGSPRTQVGRNEDEVLHRVRLTKPYWLATTEVTQAVWISIAAMAFNPSQQKGESLPVSNVSWDDCQTFVRLLNARVEGGGFRLPTEAEWENACRAGSAARFCFGDDKRVLAEYAWYGENSDASAHPVSMLKPNAWGLHDMHGNLWEWCEDGYEEYWSLADGPVTDPLGRPGARCHVLRGGAWYYTSHSLNCSTRNRAGPGSLGTRPWFIGMRLARSATAGAPAPQAAAGNVAPVQGPVAGPQGNAGPPPRALSDKEREAMEEAAAQVLIEIHKSLIEQWKNNLTDEQIGQRLLGFVRDYAGTVKARQLLESPYEPYPRMRVLMETAKASTRAGGTPK